MRNTLSTISKSAFFLGILLATARVAPAQAMVSAQRGAEIAPFTLSPTIFAVDIAYSVPFHNGRVK